MSEEIVKIPINGVLDLHNFSPKEIKFLVPDYLEECLANEIYSVRIIHGKGIGNLRRTIHAILSKLKYVANFELAGEDAGHWGATLVSLKRNDSN